MSTSLMTTRRFAPLFWCQFFAAFGDNFLKTALVFVILFQVSGANSGVLITLAGATLIAPFFFLSGLGGELADRYDKAFVAQRIKLVEIGAAVLALPALPSIRSSCCSSRCFLFGTLASLFGPIKYGILPDHLERKELPSGNALIEGGTFLAILLGTIVAGVAANGNSNPIHFAWLMILTALASWISSLLHPATGEGAPGLAINRNVLVSTAALIKQVRADPRLWWGAIVVSWFWLVGALSCRCCRRW
jgi:acyl-[acyl-carrier-protein]-phospholipid O-acyltransferase/long-chain-fatty-acid--[acyl-carrier-protein] ligase